MPTRRGDEKEQVNGNGKMSRRLPPIQFRPAPPLAAEVERRTPPGVTGAAVTKREIERYYKLLREALQTVHLEATEAEFLVRAIGNPWREDLEGQSSSPSLLVNAVVVAAGAAKSNGSRPKFDVDALVQKVMGWDAAQKAAVTDAVERVWLCEGWGAGSPAGEVMREAGLIH